MDTNFDKLRQVMPGDSKIVIAEICGDGVLSDNAFLDSSLPKFCRIRIESTPGKGSYIRSEVWLPEDWNGIFIGLGNGGMAGSICYGALAQFVKQGYAVANTDMGTSCGVVSGINNPDVWKDFGWRATHIMTVCAKSIIRTYYGKKEEFSYFTGSSTGGEQAYAEAQRFPDDYDGILAGVPANNRIFLHTYFLWNYRHLHTRNSEPMFGAEEISAISDCAVDFFQQKGDGMPGDDFISCPYAGADTVDEFIAFLRKRCPGLSDEQADSLRAVYNGPVNPMTGEQIYNGMPIGSEIYWCGIADHQREQSPHFYPFMWAFGGEYDGKSFDFASDLDKMSNVLSGDLNANSPDLTAFKNKGGKLLAFSGSADPCVPYPDAMKYYNRVCDLMGGYGAVSEFFRYFLIPGKDHGDGGKGANRYWQNEQGRSLIDALRDWREKGTVPEYISVAHCTVSEGKEICGTARKVYPYISDRKEGVSMCTCCSERYLREGSNAGVSVGCAEDE